MPGPSLIERLKASRLVQVLIVYLGASWVVIEVADQLQEALELPSWLVPVAIVLLLVGLVVMLGTAWVQSNPTTDAREAAGEVPDSWEVGFGDLVGEIRRGRMPHLTWGRALVGGVVALSLLFGLAGVYVLLGGPSPLRAPSELSAEEAGTGLAIVPFSVSGVDADVYREGMITLLGTTLDGVPGLRAVDSRNVLARWDEVVSDRERPDLSEVLEVARRAGARYALIGSAVAAGVDVSLVAEIYDTESGERIGTARAQAPADSLMTQVDLLSVETARVLFAGGEAGVDLQHLSSLTTRSLEALLAYIEGERAYRAGDWEGSLGAYERAIEQDSTFALAHLRASQALGWTTGSGDPEVIRHMEGARRFSTRLPARERALLHALVGVRQADIGAVEEAEDAVRRYPDDPDLWNAFGELLYHVGQKAMRPREEAIEALGRAADLAPGVAPYRIHLTQHAIAYGDSSDAREALDLEDALIADTAGTAGYHGDHVAAFDLLHGDSVERAAALAHVRISGPSGYLLSSLRGLHRLDALETAYAAMFDAEPRINFVRREYGRALIRRGRVQATLAALPRDEPIGAEIRGDLFEYGLVPADSLRGLTWDDDPVGGAVAALALGDAEAFDSARSAFSREMDALYAANPELESDPTGPRAALQFLDAYRLWKLEGAAAARQPMLDVYERIPGFLADRFLFLLGTIAQELGDEQEAFERYRAAAETDPFAALRAARLADRLGQADEARRLYQAVLIAWQDADPEFEPWLEEARGWLERIPG